MLFAWVSLDPDRGYVSWVYTGICQNIMAILHSCIYISTIAVFLEHQFAEFSLKESEEKMIDILQKSWKKMSDKGHKAAFELVPKLGKEEQRLVTKALA